MTRLLLLHGGAHGGWCWERVLAPLRAAAHDVDTIDLPGRGADAARARTVTLEDHVERVSEVIDGGSLPVVLVAHSLGGVTAAVLAERRPDDLERLVFVAALAPADGDATPTVPNR
jgi:pimeloyl-ACP methyl ester carboxylesterase